MLGNDLITKDVLQNEEFQCLGINDDLTDQSAIQELEHLVDEVHLETVGSDISKIIQYHDSDVTANRPCNVSQFCSTYCFFSDIGISNSTNRTQYQYGHTKGDVESGQCGYNSFSIFIHFLQDTMSLPDIALYTFDSISDAGAADVSTRINSFHFLY